MNKTSRKADKTKRLGLQAYLIVKDRVSAAVVMVRCDQQQSQAI